MVIRARIIRECAVGPPGECPVEVQLVGVTAQELRDLEDQVEAQGISFAPARVEEELAEELVEEGEEFQEEGRAVSQETREPELVCPLEPDVPWEESICGELEETLTERIAARLLDEAIERLEEGA